MSARDRADFFRRVSFLVISLFNENIEVVPFSFLRTLEEQKRLFEEGKTKTLRSKHLEGLAIDFYVLKEDRPVWNRTEEYETLGKIAKSLGLIWGGDWKSLNDIYHVEYLKE